MAAILERILSPLTGAVACFLVEDGAAVDDGDPIMEIEAFKMFTQIDAPCAGTVRLKVGLGEVVGEDDLLAEIIEGP